MTKAKRAGLLMAAALAMTLTLGACDVDDGDDDGGNGVTTTTLFGTPTTIADSTTTIP